MATVTRVPLSNSTNFRGIKIAATATPGTALHTAQAGVAGADELYIYVYNSDTVGRTVTFEWGGVTAPDDNLAFLVPAQTVLLCAPGLSLQNGLVIRAFGSAANVLVATGGSYVNRITN